MSDLATIVARRLRDSLDRLATLISFQTIAADPASRMDDCIGFLDQQLAALGGHIRLLELPGARPLLYAEIPGRSPRTLLFYQHYDVMPAGKGWSSDPFRMEERDGYLFGRGIIDNKGNLAARLAALQALIEADGSLPLTVRFLIEGEEEIGSPHLGEYVQRWDDLLRGDGCMWEGGYSDAQGRIRLTLGVKGSCKLILRAHGPERDLHGKYAPISFNPAQRLAAALTALSDLDGTVRAPGYYDSVRPPGARERAWLDAAAMDLEALRREVGLGRMPVEDGRSAVERLIFFSGCSISALQAGGIGKEARTIVPATAEAWLNFRLVPDQDPEAVHRLIRVYLESIGFGDLEVLFGGGVRPARTDGSHPMVDAAIGAVETVYGAAPVVWPMAPGTGPMATVCHDRGMQAVSIGVGHEGSGAHGPDENIRVEDFNLGIQAMAEFLRRYAAS